MVSEERTTSVVRGIANAMGDDIRPETIARMIARARTLSRGEFARWMHLEIGFFYPGCAAYIWAAVRRHDRTRAKERGE